jgi:hypothetical protein
VSSLGYIAAVEDPGQELVELAVPDAQDCTHCRHLPAKDSHYEDVQRWLKQTPICRILWGCDNLSLLQHCPLQGSMNPLGRGRGGRPEISTTRASVA